MSRESRFYIIMNVIKGCIGTINLGVCTSFLITKSLNLFEISIVYSILLGTTLILEYLSGNLADKCGRKKIYAFGLLLTAIQYIFYALFVDKIYIYIAAVSGGSL